MKLYFMGIGGTAMGNVALLMKQKGHTVCGTDGPIYPPMSSLLANANIDIFQGYDPQRLQSLNPDLVVIGNVISRGNPELEFLLTQNAIPFISMSELLKKEFLANTHNIVITGTHGKTTTTSIAAHLLNQTPQSPTTGFLLGGIPKNFNQGFQLGSQQPRSPVVIEGDEYDTAFFDKRSKFVHYNPSTLIVNNIEFDHADIFRDLEDIQRSFSHLLRIVPGNGHILVNGDDSNIAKLLPVSWATTYRVGQGSNNDLVIANYQTTPNGSQFDLTWQGSHWTTVNWSMTGIHNARNAAMAALSCALYVDSENLTEFDLSPLSTFLGVKRRQEVLYNDENTVVIEDFAHHPTAIAETLQALRNAYPEHHLTVAFEPRSNTACRNIHQETFAKAFEQADSVYLAPVHRPELYTDENRLDTQKLANDITPPATAFTSNQSLLTALQSLNTTSKTAYIFLSNGAFDGIMSDFVNYIGSNAKKSLQPSHS